MTRLLLIAVGGAVGSVLRYVGAAGCQRLTGGTFPVGTLMVNVVGCFFIGLLWALFAGPVRISEEWRLAMILGLLGGFTTFSSYAWETMMMAGDGRWWSAGLNILLSNGIGFVACWIAYRIGQRWFATM